MAGESKRFALIGGVPEFAAAKTEMNQKVAQ